MVWLQLHVHANAVFQMFEKMYQLVDVACSIQQYMLMRGHWYLQCSSIVQFSYGILVILILNLYGVVVSSKPVGCLFLAYCVNF